MMSLFGFEPSNLLCMSPMQCFLSNAVDTALREHNLHRPLESVAPYWLNQPMVNECKFGTVIDEVRFTLILRSQHLPLLLITTATLSYLIFSYFLNTSEQTLSLIFFSDPIFLFFFRLSSKQTLSSLSLLPRNSSSDSSTGLTQGNL